MDIVQHLKTCRKGYHQYPIHLERCPECNREYERQRYARDPQRAKKWRHENSERFREYQKKYYENNLEKMREQDKNRYKKDPSKKLKSSLKWQANNPEKANARNARRRAAKIQSAAPWADKDAIKKIYLECHRLTKETGIKHEVDHIYPLNSKYMCGLHVETNLQILTEEENCRKGNRIWPGQLDCQKD
jgi:hypothetical protein